MASTAPVGLR